MRKLAKLFLGFVLLTFSLSAFADMNLTLTQGISGAIPIVINNFSNDDQNITAVINSDLNNSGRFKTVSSSGDAVLKGSVDGNKINFQLFGKDNKPLLSQTVTVRRDNFRLGAHNVSDIVYQTLTGIRGIFSTRIAYILVHNGRYALDVADYDGFNPKPILVSHQPIMSPAWSHDGSKIAYVSFENGNPEIYMSNIASGSRTLISHYKGINGAPAFSPNDRRLALVLSRGSVAKIYIMNLATKALQQITTGNAIDTEPSFAPDGQSILFTSDRGGAPQIYRDDLTSGQVQRMSYNGHYNARSSFSPDGNQIVMIHSVGEGYGIGLQDLQTGAYLTLDSTGDDQSPSFSPNGQMVIFAKKTGVHRQLALVSTDGRIKLALPSDVGEVQEPVWSPFLD
ncbi:MAG TPA: Tol-Pal system beta propeller repeat protein TolB [Gammaproteobacteria bacterium]|nr:Tol-Pal system beta propeller repeat protein TolB [Gammaproteobacteria bacterium]